MCQQKEYSGNENDNDGLPIFIRIISNDRIFALMKDQEGRTGYDLYVPVKENEDISTLSTE